MRTICSREIFTKKCRQQQNFDSDPKEAWHYNHVTFTPIAKNFMLYCRLIYMLSMLYVRLTIKVKVGGRVTLNQATQKTKLPNLGYSFGYFPTQKDRSLCADTLNLVYNHIICDTWACCTQAKRLKDCGIKNFKTQNPLIIPIT